MGIKIQKQLLFDQRKVRFFKKRTPIKAFKVLNDQCPQVLLSGQHIRFVFLVYYTMIHIKKVLIQDVFIYAVMAESCIGKRHQSFLLF